MKRSKVSSKLILENERMERRLQVLKEMMSAEKARREVDGGIHWESGKPGAIHITNNQTQVLSGTLMNTQQPTRRDITKPIKVKFLNEKQDQKPVLRCGQCGQRAASLSCVECGEDYCQVCYAKMHQKGAMAKHHVKPILNKVRPIAPRVDSVANTVTFGEVTRVSPEPCVESETNGGCSLLDGTYDEESSAQSFQEALKEWRNGRNVAVESKETSVDSPRKIIVMSGSTQAGEGSIMPKEGIIFSFPDNNHISYFEKLILQRCRESPGRNPLLESVEGKRSDKTRLSTKKMDISLNDMDNEEEEGESPQAVSEYNIFYNDEDEGFPPAASSEDILLDYTGVMTPTEVLIRDMPATSSAPISSETNPSTDEQDKDSSHKTVHTTSKPAPTKPMVLTKPKQKIRTRSKPTSSKMTTLQHGEKKLLGKKAKKQQVAQVDKVGSKVATVQQLMEANLVKSVQLAWQTCHRDSAHSQMLGAFFLHGVDLARDGADSSTVKQLSLNTDTAQTTFKLGKSTWAPDSSTLEENKHTNNIHSSKVTTSGSRPSTRSGYRDPYYDDDEPDSEPENEREEFISSRLGYTPELKEYGRISQTSTSNYHNLEREEEEDEQLEWDQADCDALEDLVSELQASTTNFKRSIGASRSDNEEDSEEEEEEGSGDSFGEEDMSRVQSDFDLYQRKLLDQDSD